jgi:alpha-mannosidase
MQSRFVRTMSLLFIAFFLSPDLYAQQAGDEIDVSVLDQVEGVAPSSTGIFLNGYRRTISGELISYRSSHPDAEIALLVRARMDAHSISWVTDTVPEIYQGQQYRFIWLAGLEHGGFQNPNEVHSFDLLVNGERWFTFRNLKDSTAKKWMVRSPNGSELSFEATMVDRAGDLFGNMYLNVPRRLLGPGKPLTLQVVGENAGSGDWFMTFQYSFSFEPQVRVEPALLREQNRESQLLRLSLDNLQGGRTVQISAASRTMAPMPLQVGANVFFVHVEASTTRKMIPVFFAINGKPISRRYVTLDPVKRRQIYLLSYSHNDIGYTDLQPNIEKKQWRNLEEALRIIKKTRDYPEDARYKWNMEVLWSLDGYLRQATDSIRAEVIQAIREGNIGLNAFYANVLTGLTNAVEMTHLTEFARTLESTFSVPITTALVSDVPGFSWGIVPSLAQSGVRYFSSSPNSGDRIGYTLDDWGDKPFYWLSQSGKERILMWVAGASYASFHEGTLTKLGDEKVFKMLRKLDETNYPYQIVQLPYTVGGDNGPPDPDLPDFVKRWNEKYTSPRLIIATHEQMFKEFERRYGPALPTYSGDFTPYWEDGAASSANETAVNRQSADRLIQTEALWAMRAPESFPESEFAAAWRDLILYDEHTWGAYNSISEPDLPFVKGQWAIKRSFAADADSLSRALQLRIIPAEESRQKPGNGFDVYNTQSWPRTDIVYLSKEHSVGGDLVTDEVGNRIPSQRLSSGELAVLVKNVPPMCAKRFFVKKGGAFTVGSTTVSGHVVENGFLSLSINPASGAIESLLWKRNGLQLVDVGDWTGLNEFLYVPGKNPEDAKRLSNVRVTVKERGKLISSLLVQADAPGCKSFSYEARVFDGISRIDLIDEFDKDTIRAKEGVHIAFPFSIQDGQLRYDVAFGVVRPDSDQLPGSCKNFFSVQSWVDVSNDQRGITWSSPDAPLIEIGTITAEKPWLKRTRSTQSFFSYVMNNYWHTNYKADQGGQTTFRYSILPHGVFDGAEATKFGIEQRQPLIVNPADSSRMLNKPLFELEPATVVMLSTKSLPLEHAWLLLLYNPTSLSRTVTLQWNKDVQVSMCSSDCFGRIGGQLESSFEVAAYGSCYVRVNRR